MNYLFNVKKDIIEEKGDIILYSGNVNTYTFSFEMDEAWNNYTKFAVFIKGECAYNVLIEDNCITVPQQILQQPGDVDFGIYGTNDDIDKRLSTNLLTLKINLGSYSDGVAPPVYTPDVWETLLSKYLPKIINNNWHIYDLESRSYIDTGVSAKVEVPEVDLSDYYSKTQTHTAINTSIQAAILDSWEVEV